MKFLKNLKIKGKLRMPIIFQLILLLVFVYFYFSIQHLITSEQENKKVISKTAGKLRTFSTTIADYLNRKGKKSDEEVNADYVEITKLITSAPVLKNAYKIKPLLALTDQFKKVNEISKKNLDIEKQVFELTDLSIKQSNGFLSQISKKLADKTQRTSVSDLERAVIAGASVNSSANFSIKILFLQVKENPKLAGSLTAYLDQVIKNTETDEQRLAGTAFAQLPKKAKEANIKIKGLSTTFIANSKVLDQFKEKISTVSNTALEYTNRLDNNANQHIFTAVKQYFFSFLIIMLVVTLVAAVIGITMTRWITTPLNAMMDRAYDLAVDDVDLTRRLDTTGKDELGELSQWFNKFLERLHHLIIDIIQQSGMLHVTTGEIRHGSDELASRTSEQATAITETASTLDQFTTAIRANTENSAEADMMLADFNNEIQEKSVLIDNVTKTMTDIFESSKQIDNIIKVINDISFQTNLLALNAAVEAARAGEAGRGFAVVAAEVRNLAQKTAESSKSIQQIVIRNVESTQKGMELVKDTSQFFGEIVGVMGEIVTKISNITSVSREQSTGIEQIGETISQMERVSTQNAELVQQLAQAGQSVETKAVDMQALVAHFKVDERDEKKGSDYFTERVHQKQKKKEKTIEKPAVKKGLSTSSKKVKVPIVSKPGELSTGTPTPTEDDFFGNVDESFEEF